MQSYPRDKGHQGLHSRAGLVSYRQQQKKGEKKGSPSKCQVDPPLTTEAAAVHPAAHRVPGRQLQ